MSILYPKVVELKPGEVGLAGVLLNTTNSSSWLDTRGASQMTVDIAFTRVAGTNLTFYLDTSDVAAPTGVQIGQYPVANDSGSGVVDYYRRQFRWTTSSTGTYTFNIPINSRYVRIRDLTAASGGASDTANVFVTFKTV